MKSYNQLEEFLHLKDELLQSHQFHLEDFGEYIFSLQPKNRLSSGYKKSISLMGLTHGNEVAGAYVLNNFLRLILNNKVQINNTIYFILGNPKAYLKNIRYLEKDLNRCFASVELKTYEDRRSKEIQKVIKRSDILIDFHQTQTYTPQAFFVITSNDYNLKFLKQLDFRIPVLDLHNPSTNHTNSSPFLTADEYMGEINKIGVAVELGTKGFCNDQITLGLSILHQTFKILNRPHILYSDQLDIYKELTKVKRNCDCCQLSKKIENFYKVKKGEIVAMCLHGEIKSPVNGHVIFPKKDNKVKVNSPLFTILKRIRE